MSFSLSGVTITQTGVDADLSGIDGNGATKDSVGVGSAEHSVYDADNKKLDIVGTLTIDPRIELLKFNDSPANTIQIKNNGVLNIGKKYTVNSYETETIGDGLIIPSTNLVACCSQGAIITRSGGSFNMYGATAKISSVIEWLPGSSVDIKNGIIENRRGSLIRIRSDATDMTIDGLQFFGGVSIDFFEAPNSISGYFPQSGERAGEFVSTAAGGTDATYIFRDYNSAGLDYDFSLWRGADCHFINIAKDGEMSNRHNDGTASNEKGLTRISKEFTLSLVDGGNVPIQDAKLYISDTDNGNRANRIPRNGTDYDLLSTKVYTDTSNSLGVFGTTSVLTRVLYRDVVDEVDYRSKNNNSDDTFDIKLFSYLHSYKLVTQDLKGSGVLSLSDKMFADSNITETTKATVDAYTELETPQKLYDRAKSYLHDNYVGETDTIVSRSGETIDAGTYNVVIDATASSAFAFDGSTITIHADTFTGSVTTTGTVTLRNGALVSGGTYSHVILESGFSGIVDLANVQITELENTTGNNLQISLSGTSTIPTTLTETSGTLNIASILTVTDISGDSIKLIAWNSNNVTAGNEIKAYSDSTSHVIDTFGVTSVRIAVDKPGYYARIYTVPISTTQQTLVVNMTQSPAVDVATDISALIAASTMTLATNPYSLGFDVLRATIDGDFEDISAAEWRRYHDYFSEVEQGLSLLGINNLNGDQVYQTTESGVAILRPVLEAYVDGTHTVNTFAFVDESAAKVLYPLYDYTPRNAQNVSIEYQSVEPLVDYGRITDSVWGALASENNVSGTMGAAAQTSGSGGGSGGGATAQEIWEYDISSITTEGQAGKELKDAQTDISSLATQVSVDALPDAAAINAEVDTALSDYDAPTRAELTSDIASVISTINGLNDIAATDVWAVASRTITDKTGFELTAAQHSAIATAVEQAILNEGDGQQVLNAIVGAIGNTNVDQVALVAAIRADLERTGGKIDNIETDTHELQSNQGDWATAVGFSTPVDLSAVQSALTAEINANETKIDAVKTVVDAIDPLTQQETRDAMKLSPSAGVAATDSIDDKIDNVSGGGSSATPADIYSYFTDSNRADVFKADVTGLALETTLNAVNAAISNLNDISTADVTSATPSATDIATAVEAAIINEGDANQVIDAILQVFNANLDIPALELTAIAQAVRAEIATELGRIDADISSRSDLTAAQVNSEVDQALADYDSPTKAELDTAIAAVNSSISDVEAKADILLKIETNRWLITNNQLIIYDNDGTTALYTFDLYDNSGSPTSNSPFERRPV